MLAMVLEEIGQPLRPVVRPKPRPAGGQVLVRVHACAVCRTDLHVVDGELADSVLPLVPGHQIVGTIEAVGEGVAQRSVGQHVGVPWLGAVCGSCRFCLDGQENLCDEARFTGYQIDGGFAEYAVADEHFCFPLSPDYPDPQAAPLLCAGLIGYRAFRMVGEVESVGLYGFGAAAHILAQVAKHECVDVYAFTRPGDQEAQGLAMDLGAVWAGGSDQAPPRTLDAAIIFAPVGELVPVALGAVVKGGTVVCAGIHMSQIPSFDYQLLWGERQLRSVANLTRRDAEDFLQLAPQIPVQTEVEPFALVEANEALAALRAGRIKGSAVLVVDRDQTVKRFA